MLTLKLYSRGAEVKELQRRLNLVQDGIFGPITEEAVREFQKTKGLMNDGVVGEMTWKALGCTSNKRNIKEIIVHCSATPDGKDFTVEQIRQAHLARNFSDIGYHYVIYRDGSIHKGRAEEVIGAHCTNHNAISIGVCYIGGVSQVGNKPMDTRTEAQKASLIKLLKELKAKYPLAKIHSHKDFANKACPSFDATKEYSKL